MRGQLWLTAWLVGLAAWSEQKRAGGSLEAVWQSLVLETAGICPRLQRRVSEEARVVAVQRAILDGLGLDAPPPEPVGLLPPSLPQPLITPPEAVHRILDRLVLPPTGIQCEGDDNSIDLKLVYAIPSHLKTKSLSSAKIFLYTGCKEDNLEMKKPQFLGYSIIVRKCTDTSSELRPIKGQKWINKEWIELNVRNPLIPLMRMGIECVIVSLSITGPVKASCVAHSLAGSKPYLAIEYVNNPKERRKRGRECHGNYSECCRDDFYISFKEIGWDQWVVGPAVYNAFICRGNCSNATAVTIPASGHQINLNRMRLSGQRGDIPMSCCAPTKLGGDRFIVNYPNGSLIHSYIDNIIVKACGCH